LCQVKFSIWISVRKCGHTYHGTNMICTILQVCSTLHSGKAFFQKHSLPLIPFIPKLIMQVDDTWKSHILQVFLIVLTLVWKSLFTANNCCIIYLLKVWSLTMYTYFILTVLRSLHSCEWKFSIILISDFYRGFQEVWSRVFNEIGLSFSSRRNAISCKLLHLYLIIYTCSPQSILSSNKPSRVYEG